MRRSSTVVVDSVLVAASKAVVIAYVAASAPFSRSSQRPSQSHSTVSFPSNDLLVQRKYQRPPTSVMATIETLRSLPRLHVPRYPVSDTIGGTSHADSAAAARRASPI